MMSGDHKSRPTLQTIADKLGISRASVSYAFNRPEQISPELRERVLAAAVELGYGGPDPLAVSFRTGRTNTVALVLRETLEFVFADPGTRQFLQGVAAASSHYGSALMLVPTLHLPDAVETVRSTPVDAFVFYSVPDRDEIMEAALRSGRPVVVIDQPAVPEAFFVGIDDFTGARSAAEHVLGLGHRHIGIVALCGHTERRSSRATMPAIAARRLAGYRAAVEQAGLNWKTIPIESVANNTPEDGKMAFAQLMKRSAGLTAVLFMSDQLASGGVEAAAASGRSVPADISIVGFDGLDVALAGDRKLTTIYQSFFDKAEAAIELMQQGISGAAPQSRILPTRLTIGTTTSRP